MALQKTCLFQMLREGLDKAGFNHVQIVGGEAASWDIIKDFLKDPDLAKAVDIIGWVYHI